MSTSRANNQGVLAAAARSVQNSNISFAPAASASAHNLNFELSFAPTHIRKGLHDPTTKKIGKYEASALDNIHWVHFIYESSNKAAHASNYIFSHLNIFEFKLQSPPHINTPEAGFQDYPANVAFLRVPKEYYEMLQSFIQSELSLASLKSKFKAYKDIITETKASLNYQNAPMLQRFTSYLDSQMSSTSVMPSNTQAAASSASSTQGPAAASPTAASAQGSAAAAASSSQGPAAASAKVSLLSTSQVSSALSSAAPMFNPQLAASVSANNNPGLNTGLANPNIVQSHSSASAAAAIPHISGYAAAAQHMTQRSSGLAASFNQPAHQYNQAQASQPLLQTQVGFTPMHLGMGFQPISINPQQPWRAAANSNNQHSSNSYSQSNTNRGRGRGTRRG